MFVQYNFLGVTNKRTNFLSLENYNSLLGIRIEKNWLFFVVAGDTGISQPTTANDDQPKNDFVFFLPKMKRVAASHLVFLTSINRLSSLICELSHLSGC